jgi:hypothetical protein
VNYQDLLDFLLKDENDMTGRNLTDSGLGGRTSHGGVDGNGSGDREVDQWVDRIRDVFLKAKRRGVDYRQSFEHFDVEFTGEISQRHFLKGLDELNITLPHARNGNGRDSGGDIGQKVRRSLFLLCYVAVFCAT